MDINPLLTAMVETTDHMEENAPYAIFIVTDLERAAQAFHDTGFDHTGVMIQNLANSLRDIYNV